jgi:Leucine-rich repeat (LRR) protein
MFSIINIFRIFPVFTLLTLSHATDINIKCDYILITILKVKQIYKCKVENFVAENKFDKIAVVNGIQKSDKTNQDVQFFIMENQICHYLPADIGVHFPNLNHVDIKNSSVLKIEQSSLKSMPNLKILYLKKNFISEIERDLFKFNPHLEFINFDDNRITKIDIDFIKNLQNIVSVSLERNECIDSFGIDEMSMRTLLNQIKINCT